MSQIKITKYKNKIKISGHSMPHICSAISSVTYTGVNMIANIISPDAITFEDKGMDEYILITFNSRGKKAKNAMVVMMQMYRDVSEQSPDGTVIIEDLDEV